MKKEWTGTAYHYDSGPIVVTKYVSDRCLFEIYIRGSDRKYLVDLRSLGEYNVPLQVGPETHDKAHAFAMEHFNLGGQHA